MTIAKRPSNRISSFILFATVAGVPFPFGSMAPAAIAFWCIILGLGAILVSPRGLRREHLPLLGLAMIVTLAYAFVLHEQLAARPWIGSPQPLWREAAETLGMPIAPSVSIARNEPFLALGAPLANMLALMCSFVVCIDRDRARQLLLVVAWSGVAYAGYGIAAYLSDPTHVLWLEAPAGHTLSSTFQYRSTAAVYFGSCAGLWLLFVLQHLRRRLPLDSIYWRSAPSLLLSELPILSTIMLLICLAAMLMTYSRAGVALSFMALAVAFAGFFYRDLRRRGSIGAGLVFGGLAVFFFLEVLGGNVIQRFETEGFVDPGRLETYRSTVRLIADHPWFGTGLGTFVWSFPAYRSGVSMWGVWEFAHSTPLELAGDLGLPLTGLIGLGWLFVLVVLVRGVRTRRNDRIAPAGALTLAVLFLAHSFIDFSPQNPGYAIVVFAVVGAGLAQSFSSHNANGERINSAQNRTSPERSPRFTRTVAVQ
jgi:O-antigen ligase